MAISPFITSAIQKIREKDVLRNRPNSENVNAKIGSSINALIDSMYYVQKFTFQGFLTTATGTSEFALDEGVGGVERINRISDILEYHMFIQFTGDGGDIALNARLYNAAGASLGTLFGSGANRLLYNGANKTRVFLGRSIENSTTFNFGTTGGSFQFGNLSNTVLQAGTVIVPYIEAAANASYNATLAIKLREQ